MASSHETLKNLQGKIVNCMFFFPKEKLHILHYHFGSTELLITQYLNPSPEHKDTQDN